MNKGAWALVALLLVVSKVGGQASSSEYEVEIEDSVSEIEVEYGPCGAEGWVSLIIFAIVFVLALIMIMWSAQSDDDNLYVNMLGLVIFITVALIFLDVALVSKTGCGQFIRTDGIGHWYIRWAVYILTQGALAWMIAMYGFCGATGRIWVLAQVFFAALNAAGPLMAGFRIDEGGWWTLGWVGIFGILGWASCYWASCDHMKSKASGWWVYFFTYFIPIFAWSWNFTFYMLGRSAYNEIADFECWAYLISEVLQYVFLATILVWRAGSITKFYKKPV